MPTMWQICIKLQVWNPSSSTSSRGKIDLGTILVLTKPPVCVILCSVIQKILPGTGVFQPHGVLISAKGNPTPHLPNCPPVKSVVSKALYIWSRPGKAFRVLKINFWVQVWVFFESEGWLCGWNALEADYTSRIYLPRNCSWAISG